MATLPYGVAVPHAADANPTNDEAAGLIHRRPRSPEGDCMHCIADPTAALADGRDRFPDYAARAVKAGACLHRLAGGGYALTGRNGWGRELPDLRAVGALLSRIDGRPS